MSRKKSSGSDDSNSDTEDYSNFSRTLFSQFHVKTEDELAQKLFKESETIPCRCCHRERHIDLLRFNREGDPICVFCLADLREALGECEDEA
jgi:hypothetical protein